MQVEGHSRRNKLAQSCYEPTDISILMAFILYSVSMVFFGLMVASYIHRINNHHLINSNPMSQMLHDSNSFLKQMNDNVSAHTILRAYKWLENFHDLIHENCRTKHTKVKYSQFMAYCMACYNFFLIHLLFVKTSRFSFVAFVPILIACGSIFLDSQQVLLYAVLDFTQMLLCVIIIQLFIFMKEKRMKSSLLLEQHSKNNT